MDRLPLTTRADTSGIPSLDGLCLGGALMVALYHVAHYYVKLGGPAAFEAAHGDPLGGMLLRCDAGVMLLALAGGFALGRPLAERRLAGLPGESWWAFVRRETALRYPLYALVLTVFLVCLLWVVRVRFAELAPHFVAGLLAMHGAAFGYENPINTSAWLVEAELQFVLVAPLLGSVFGLGGTVARRATLAGIALGSAAALHRFVAPDAPLQLTGVGLLPLYALGFLLADLYVTAWRVPSVRGGTWDLLGLVALAVLLAVWGNRDAGGLAAPVAAAAVGAAAFRGARARRWLAATPAALRGRWYVIYLLHGPLVVMLVRQTRELTAARSLDVNLLLQVALVLPAVVLVGLAARAGSWLVARLQPAPASLGTE